MPRPYRASFWLRFSFFPGNRRFFFGRSLFFGGVINCAGNLNSANFFFFFASVYFWPKSIIEVTGYFFLPTLWTKKLFRKTEFFRTRDSKCTDLRKMWPRCEEKTTQYWKISRCGGKEAQWACTRLTTHNFFARTIFLERGAHIKRNPGYFNAGGKSWLLFDLMQWHYHLVRSIIRTFFFFSEWFLRGDGNEIRHIFSPGVVKVNFFYSLFTGRLIN